MKHLLLFDIDGTLVRMKKGRSRTVFRQVFSEVYGVHVPDEIFGHFAGRTDLHIIHETAKELGISQQRTDAGIVEFFRLLPLYFREYSSVEHIDILPGVSEIVEHLHLRDDVLLFLLTGNVRQPAYMKLAPFGLDAYFPDGAFGDISMNRSDLVPVALRKANSFVGEERFHAANTVVIGDTPADVACARDNELRVLSVGTGLYSEKELCSHQPDAYLESFGDFAVSLQTIEGFLT